MKLLAMWLLLVAYAWARVGGGEGYSSPSSSSYSGGSSSSSGGGDGGGAGLLIELAFRLIFYYPKIGIPLLVFGLFLYWKMNQPNSGMVSFDRLQAWSPAKERRSQRTYGLAVPKEPDYWDLQQDDPNFSRPLFLDFVSLLYIRARTSTASELAVVGAYMSAGVRTALQNEAPWMRAILGGIRVVSVLRGQSDSEVVVEVEANLEAPDRPALYVVEHLVLRRRIGAKTPPPETVYKFSCPNCGNSAPVDREGRCTSCQTQVNDGRFAWLLTGVRQIKTAPKPRIDLSSGGVEQGTELPTRRDPNISNALTQLKSTDPEFDLSSLETTARTTFLKLQAAWSSVDWELARPLESDQLFTQHQMWMEMYASEGLRNVLEDISVQRMELARIETDRYFESVTFRLFASMKDYTVRVNDGALVAGDPHRPRVFSEYWTFLRRSGVTTKKRESTACPNCGAPLDRVNMAGVCEYCDANITRGDFDWVLSRIEQDEAYR